MKRKKIVSNQRFATAYKGYDPKDVDNFIRAEQAKAQEVQLEQIERITALKNQCAELSNEISSMRAREDQIKSTLVSATEKAEKMTEDLKLRYNSELKRLQLFRAKWEHAYEEIKERYHFSKDALNMESVAVSIKLEIERYLARDFSMDKGDKGDAFDEHFMNEVERLAAPKSEVELLKQKLDEAQRKKDAKFKNDISIGKQNSPFSLEKLASNNDGMDSLFNSLVLKAVNK